MKKIVKNARRVRVMNSDVADAAANTKAKPAAKKKAAAKKAAPKKKPAAAKKPAKAKGESKPRGQFIGKKLRALVKENTRREGSHGHKSLGIILKKPGIVYEDFLKAGGRSKDLAWDVAHETVAAK